MGFNIIVYFVNLAILFLMMGAFLWLVVAYAANLSIKGGVRWAYGLFVQDARTLLLVDTLHGLDWFCLCSSGTCREC